ncbi:hypothetical protein [Bacillus sp. NPDC077027]|uniref:hypothetical protein n=1 Tax=Bacillus sp. NPDC077027 TaxID=3390548 RepID=UPI003CFECCE7
MIGYFIVACEIGFWVFILLGFILRYMFGKKKWGAFFLICTPVLDLLLLIATYMDLQRGAEATIEHGLAAIYIGVSLSFGHQIIKWADARFAYRFAGGPKPASKPKYGRERSINEMIGWARHFIAWAIGAGLLYGLHFLIGEPKRTETLFQFSNVWGMILLLDLLISLSYVIWPKKKTAGRDILNS